VAATEAVRATLVAISQFWGPARALLEDDVRAAARAVPGVIVQAGSSSRRSATSTRPPTADLPRASAGRELPVGAVAEDFDSLLEPAAPDHRRVGLAAAAARRSGQRGGAGWAIITIFARLGAGRRSQRRPGDDLGRLRWIPGVVAHHRLARGQRHQRHHSPGLHLRRRAILPGLPHPGDGGGLGDATSLVLAVQTLRQTELVNTEDDPGFGVDPGSAILPTAPAGS
jgi:hypothetical protein